jgi:hypothetical protein
MQVMNFSGERKTRLKIRIQGLTFSTALQQGEKFSQERNFT